MLINRAYYLLKPIIPARWRLAMRRIRAQRIRRRCGASWPIFEPTGRPPEGWPGWPEGKEFAFVLTHDVEGQRGVDRCRQLAELEMECGFRSSFNFIPNGEYSVPEDLLRWLREHGFEVGVHDYRHDGKLFQSFDAFSRNAQGINRQLAAWKARGFRAGFMLHKLDWLHQLEIDYDASTFDVDPFEPQPDGAQTVFPFWVRRPDQNADALNRNRGEKSEANGEMEGYIELPYTLLQDYNCFVVLQERSIDIWRRKLRWLVSKRAMALLDTHPDYMNFPGKTANAHDFPVELYREFLNHVRQDYAGRYWQALPLEVANYCRSFRPKQARPPRRIIMLSYSFYDFDNRVRRYAETLAQRGDDVRVLCIGNEEQVSKGDWETIHGVKVLRLQTRPTLENSKWAHATRLVRFFLRALSQLNPRKLPGGCDLLHVHNIPDFLVFAGLRLKLAGTKIIFDIHDIVPELYASKFPDSHETLASSALRFIERCACRFADHVIIANHIWKETLLSRSAPPEKVTALVNYVDPEHFSPHRRTRTDDRIILLYPGSLNRHQGLDVAIAAMPALLREFSKIELHIYGAGRALPELIEQAKSLALGDAVQFFPGVPTRRVPQLMADADIGIVPKRAEGFGDQAYSTKIMEFMSQGLPVVLSRTRIDSMYFDDSVVSFFKSGDSGDFARAVRQILLDPAYRAALRERGLEYAEKNSWDVMKGVYLDIVDRLTMTAIPTAGGGGLSPDLVAQSVSQPVAALPR